jgi:hypothetical protein
MNIDIVFDLVINIYYINFNYLQLSILYKVNKLFKNIINDCKIIPINTLIQNHLYINIDDIYFLLKYNHNFKLLYIMLKYRPYYKHQFIINVITFFLQKKNIIFDKIDVNIYSEILDITDNIFKYSKEILIREKSIKNNYEKYYKERFGKYGKIYCFIINKRDDYIKQELISYEIEKNELLHFYKYSNIYKKLLNY